MGDGEPDGGGGASAESAGIDVFISYSSRDRNVADAACQALEQRGIRCWIAPRDIVGGSDWGQSILDALAAVHAVVLIFSQNANDSIQVRSEVLAAIEGGKVIIPFRIQDVAPAGSLKLHLTGVHWLDAITPPIEGHLGALATTVRTVLAKSGRMLPQIVDYDDREGLGTRTARGRHSRRRWRAPVLVAGLLAFVAVAAVATLALLHRPSGAETQAGAHPVPTLAQPAATPAPEQAPPVAPSRPALGIVVRTLTPDLAALMRSGTQIEHAPGPQGQGAIIPGQGAIITSVRETSPATLAGLQPGDVVTQLGSAAIANAGDVTAAIDGMKPGESVHADVWRGGHALSVQLTVGTAPDTPSFSGRDALRHLLPGEEQDFSSETEDHGVAPGDHPKGFEGWTPILIPGATTVTTRQLERALHGRMDFDLIDVTGCDHKTIPGAVCLYWGTDPQRRSVFKKALAALSGNAIDDPIVIFCTGAQCWMSVDAVRYALDLGYRDIFWYRGGRRSWGAADLPVEESWLELAPTDR